MNLRELIDALLRHNKPTDTEVVIESGDGIFIKIARVDLEKSISKLPKSLVLVPSEKLLTIQDAEIKFQAK
jgi:hypothetical protein